MKLKKLLILAMLPVLASCDMDISLRKLDMTMDDLEKLVISIAEHKEKFTFHLSEKHADQIEKFAPHYTPSKIKYTYEFDGYALNNGYTKTSKGNGKIDNSETFSFTFTNGYFANEDLTKYIFYQDFQLDNADERLDLELKPGKQYFEIEKDVASNEDFEIAKMFYETENAYSFTASIIIENIYPDFLAVANDSDGSLMLTSIYEGYLDGDITSGVEVQNTSNLVTQNDLIKNYDIAASENYKEDNYIFTTALHGQLKQINHSPVLHPDLTEYQKVDVKNAEGMMYQVLFSENI